MSSLAAAGVDVPEPWMGILDVLRMVEGHLPEPTEGRPLGVVGLEALLRAVPGDGTTVLQAVRRGMSEARRYFTWKEIPVVLILEGHIENPPEGSGLQLTRSERHWSLAPLLGTGFSSARPDTSGWWWAPQIG